MPLNVDSDGILQPLGILVLRDSRFEILPGIREYTEEIPGVDGEFDFGFDFRHKTLELVCAIEVEPAERPAKLREIANYLNPRKGIQTLTFADDPGKVYYVRYAGKMPLEKYASWIQFPIQFKLFTSTNGDKTSPYYYNAIQSELVGSGTAVNNGNEETPFTLTIQGPVTNPSVTVAGYAMTYTGTIETASVLIIDTEKMTVTLNGTNATPNYNGVFPKLQLGDNEVVAASAGTTILNWLDRWI